MKAWKAGVINRVHSHDSVDVKYDTFPNQTRGLCHLECNVPFARVVLYREVGGPPSQVGGAKKKRSEEEEVQKSLKNIHM